MFQNKTAIPEITSKITSDINKKKKNSKNFEFSENPERDAVNFKLKHFTPRTQREILRCLSGFEVSDKIKKITNDIFKSNLKEVPAGNDIQLING